MTTQPTADKLDFKKILPIFLIVLVDLLGLTIIIPLLPLYASTFNADAFTIGLLGAAYPLMQFIGAPILGRLSDRYGRKPILMISQIGTLIGFLVLGVANSLALLFIARIIDGLSGANISTAQAVITDSTNEKTRTQALGLLGAAFGLGFIIGPMIAFITLALSGNNYHVPAFIAAGFSVLSILLTMTRLEETHKPGTVSTERAPFSIGEFFRVVRNPAIGLLLVLMFAQQIAFGGFEQFLSLFTLTRLGLDASGNAIVFTFVGVIVVLVQGYFIRSWSRRFGDRKLIFGALACLAFGLALTAITPQQPVTWYDKAKLAAELSSGKGAVGEGTGIQATSLTLPDDSQKGLVGIGWLLIMMVPASIGGALLQPTINSLLTKRVDKSEIGGTLGVSTSMVSASNVIAPLLMGWLFQSFGNSTPFLVAAVILAVLFLVALSVLKPGREEQAEAPHMTATAH